MKQEESSVKEERRKKNNWMKNNFINIDNCLKMNLKLNIFQTKNLEKA